MRMDEDTNVRDHLVKFNSHVIELFNVVVKI